MNTLLHYEKKPSVYGTGLFALDIVIGTETNKAAYQWAGGTCGNVLTILSFLGWSSFPLARLDNESSSNRVKEDMKNWGVRLDFAELQPSANVPIITQEITKDKNGHPKHRFHWKNCPKCGSYLPNFKSITLKQAEVVKERVHRGNVFFFDRTSPAAIDLARHFKELGCLIFFEPSGKGNPKHFQQAMKVADIIKYSDERFSSSVSEKENGVGPTLEIQTKGDDGLRYRRSSENEWINIPAFKAEELKDTCGCGDWTTAGIISKLGEIDNPDLESISDEVIKNALTFGQALGAWNCSFEGARGGMYQISADEFLKEVNQILEGGTLPIRDELTPPHSDHTGDGNCPSCP